MAAYPFKEDRDARAANKTRDFKALVLLWSVWRHEDDYDSGLVGAPMDAVTALAVVRRHLRVMQAAASQHPSSGYAWSFG